MAPGQRKVKLVFLPPLNPASGDRSREGLDSAARGHASRQGHSRSARKRAALVEYHGRKPAASDLGEDELEEDLETYSDGDIDRYAAAIEGWTNRRQQMQLLSARVDRDIGSGDLDPFNTSTVAGLGRSERYLLHYALTATTESFGESPEGRMKFAHSWTWRSLESQSTLHANVMGGSVHYLINCPNLLPAHEMQAVSLRAKVMALRSLQKEIDLYQRCPKAVNADNILLTIFVLAIHHGVVSDPPNLYKSPLGACRDLGIYSRMSFGQEHMEAMYTLIEQRGGVKSLCDDTFGCVVPITDILYSFRKGVAPRLPSHHKLQPILRTDIWQPDAEADQMLENLGSAFRKGSKMSLALSLILQLEPEMVTTLLTMAELTVALDQYVRGTKGAPETLDLLLNNVDWVSHRLLSQPSYLKRDSKDIGDEGSQTTSSGSRRLALRELCRLAALLYLNLVMLPYGPYTEIRHRIAREVLDLLLSTDGPLSWAGEDRGPISDFLLWAVSLGAICSQETPMEEKFLDILKDRGMLELPWTVVEEKVKRFLWWDYVCKEPALLMWADKVE